MRHRRTLAVIAAAVAAAIVAANVVVLRGGASRSEETARAQVPSESGSPACALVLGAGVRDDGSPSDVLRDRLDESLALYESGRVTKILVSGDHHTRAYDEPNAMRRYLEARGVPAADIFMDHAGVDTYSSVWRARHVFGAERVVVVTQRFHLARAVWVARELGMQADGSAADRHVYRGIAWLHAREIVSRTKAVVDVATGRQPRHRGPRIDLALDGRVTRG
ncbi:MAG: YdcF family protein [Deltaproteobacteria bacterium]|nr:YdcF family protein [Deltaproteobacteria bacterium]